MPGAISSLTSKFPALNIFTGEQDDIPEDALTESRLPENYGRTQTLEKAIQHRLDQARITDEDLNPKPVHELRIAGLL
ncbi:MAG TPA: hypothetical protein PK513_05445 [Alphaproteobacteria bacterium]|nr:hypothetical protein [Alphaproteobacteria bacterium]USO05835.1 MAG: hypothetical protein H6859_01120 [Rhodospirillales bacterium]HOO81926.1 hypothetical protein [Alphaproteobacteria bacterium]